MAAGFTLIGSVFTKDRKLLFASLQKVAAHLRLANPLGVISPIVQACHVTLDAFLELALRNSSNPLPSSSLHFVSKKE